MNLSSKILSVAFLVVLSSFLFLFFIHGNHKNHPLNLKLPQPDNKKTALSENSTKTSNENNEGEINYNHKKENRILFRAVGNAKLPLELSLILEISDHTFLNAIARRNRESEEVTLESIPHNLRSVTILHPEYELHSNLELDPEKFNGFAGLVTCYPAPKVEISGLSELSIKGKGTLLSAFGLNLSRPNEWLNDNITQRLALISKSESWPKLSWNPKSHNNIYFHLSLQQTTSPDIMTFALPVSGPATLMFFNNNNRLINLPIQSFELRPGETTHIDLRRLDLASLSATVDIPNTWNEKIKITISQRDKFGLWENPQTYFFESNGDISVVGLRPGETRLSLCLSVSSNINLLPTECFLTLQPGENHFENVFGSPREFIVHAKTGRTAFGHQGHLFYIIRQDERIIADHAFFEPIEPLRLCAWSSNSVQLLYRTYLKGFSSEDFIVDEVLLGPSQKEVFFSPRPGSALKLSGVAWEKYRLAIILQNGKLVKAINSRNATKGEFFICHPPKGDSKIILLQDGLMLRPTRPGAEINLSSIQLRPGEVSEMQVTVQNIATRRLRFIGSKKKYKIGSIDSLGLPQAVFECSELGDGEQEIPKNIPITLISKSNDSHKLLDLKELPEGEVQTIELP